MNREALAALTVAHAAYMTAKAMIPDDLGDDVATAAFRIENDMAQLERALRKKIYGA